MISNYTIYGLMHPMFMFFYYVGVTANPLEQRVYQHMVEATRKLRFNTRAHKVNKTLYEAGLSPLAITLDSISSDDKRYGYTLEKIWMAHISEMGHPLHNQDADKWYMSYSPDAFGEITRLHEYHRSGASYDEYETATRKPPKIYGDVDINKMLHAIGVEPNGQNKSV